MTNASTPTAPARSGDITSPVSRRSVIAKRRRVFLSIVVVVVAAIAVAANYAPVRSYLEARSRLDKVAAEVAALDAQKGELQSQVGRLAEAEYLETLAREQLTYARPGEDGYIITGTPDEGTATQSEAAADGTSAGVAEGAKGAPGESGDPGDDSNGQEAANAADEPGPLERLLTAFLGLF